MMRHISAQRPHLVQVSLLISIKAIFISPSSFLYGSRQRNAHSLVLTTGINVLSPCFFGDDGEQSRARAGEVYMVSAEFDKMLFIAREMAPAARGPACSGAMIAVKASTLYIFYSFRQL